MFKCSARSRPSSFVFAFQHHRRPGPASLNLSAHSPFSSTGIPACAPSNTQQQTKILGAPRDGVLASCLLHPNSNATSATAISSVGAAQFSPGRKAWEKINAQTRHLSRRFSRDPLFLSAAQGPPNGGSKNDACAPDTRVLEAATRAPIQFAGAFRTAGVSPAPLTLPPYRWPPAGAFDFSLVPLASSALFASRWFSRGRLL